MEELLSECQRTLRYLRYMRNINSSALAKNDDHPDGVRPYCA